MNFNEFQAGYTPKNKPKTNYIEEKKKDKNVFRFYPKSGKAGNNRKTY